MVAGKEFFVEIKWNERIGQRAGKGFCQNLLPPRRPIRSFGLARQTTGTLFALYLGVQFVDLFDQVLRHLEIHFDAVLVRGDLDVVHHVAENRSGVLAPLCAAKLNSGLT